MSLRRGRDDPADIAFEERQERLAEARDEYEAGLIDDDDEPEGDEDA